MATQQPPLHAVSQSAAAVLPAHDAAWYQAAFDAMTDMVLIKGPKSRLLWANQAFLTYYGMTAEELRDIVDAPHSDPDDTLQYVIDDQTVFETASPLFIACEAVTDATGKARDFETMKSPIFERGEVARSIGVSRLRAVEKIPGRPLGHTDAKSFVAPLKTLTQEFPSPMLMLDAHARVINSSKLWVQTFGTAKGQLEDFFHECYPELHLVSQKIALSVASRSRLQTTLSLPNADGGAREFLMEISPWHIPGDVVGGTIIVATDTSELHVKTNALERANEELTQFSYRTSHDLKGPLSTVKGLASFVMHDIETGDIEEAQSNTKMIINTVSRLESTVVSILELARADLKDDAIERVSLPQLLHDVSDGLSQSVQDNDVDVQAQFDVATIMTQPVRMRQILENLVANGIKYCDPQKESRFVRVTSRASASGILLSVEDNGTGLPPGAESTAFEPFSRFDATIEGAGLGLAIVKRHVLALRGDVNLEVLDTGTRFEIVLPTQLETDGVTL